MRGVPLTPEQIEQAAEVYGRTSNYSEAARAIGVDESAVRRALKRRGEPKRAELHALAIQRGIRDARKYLRLAITQGPQRLEYAETAREYADVVSALSAAAKTLQCMAEAPERRKAAALARTKLRGEIEALARDPSEAGDISLTVNVVADGDVAVEAHGETGSNLPDN